MTLPKKWENYKAIEDKNSITFGLPIKDENWPGDKFYEGYGEIFYIEIENITDWTKKCNGFCKKDFSPICVDCAENPPEGIIGMKRLGMSDKYVFSISVVQDEHDFGDLVCNNKECNTEEFDNFVIDKVYSGFKILDSSSTSDWQTYRNEKYGFEFKYPNDWFIESRESTEKYLSDQVVGISSPETHQKNERELIALQKNPTIQDMPLWPEISIDYYNSLQDYPESEYINVSNVTSLEKVIKEGSTGSRSATWNPEEIDFAGEKAWLTSYSGLNVIATEHNKHIYTIDFVGSLYWDRKNNQPMTAFVQNFISTFKFID